MSEKHSHGQGLAGEHPLTDVGQMILFVVFVVTWVTDTFVFRYSVFTAASVPAFLRLSFGAATLIAAAALALSAHRTIFGVRGRNRGPISTGAFSFVRHPMYLGSWLFSAGLVIMSFSLSAAAVSIVILLFYYVMARHEELLLLEKFGVKYREYQARVPMFLPLRFAKRPLGDGKTPREAG
jgi:protein-S-isoprenylcysteine O-methyltransferase Ste14